MQKFQEPLLPVDQASAVRQDGSRGLVVKAILAFQILILALLAAVCYTVLPITWRRPDLDICESYIDDDIDMPFSVILTADPGDFSGVSEAHFILANLQDLRRKPRGSTVCGDVYTGTLMGQRVMVVTTGIGPPAASLCTLEVVTACGPWLSDILFFGTSGWSPQLGGVLTPPNCTAANDNQQIARLGDVCVSPFTVNWMCKKSTWDMQASGHPNQCYRPREVASPNATSLFGRCQFYAQNMAANMALADQVLAVAGTSAGMQQMPMRTKAVSAVEQRYWGAMAEATQAQYPALHTRDPPRLWNYRQCMEVDGQFFYSGVPWELKARDYAAETLQAAFGGSWSASDVLAVSAMEGIGVAEALSQYHELSTTQNVIPYTHVRTLSNWLHPPVTQVSPGVWAVAQELAEDFETGYSYAIATGSAVIMSLYQTRCQADVARHRLPHDFNCTFSIPYGKGAAMPA